MNRGFTGFVTVFAIVVGLACVACSTKKAAEQEKAAAPAPEQAAPAPEAAVPEKPAEKPADKVEKPSWPNPVPESWVIVNDYETMADFKAIDEAAKEKKEGRKGGKEVAKPHNNLGGEWGDIGFNAGKCTLEQVKDGNNTVLKVAFAMPTETSECGTYEYLMPFTEQKVKGKLIKNYPQFFDLRPYDKITFMVKSGDDKEHILKLHVTELDPYGSQLQGYVSTTKNIVAGKDWERVEFTLDETLHEFFDRRHGKLTGIRIRFQEQPERNDSGVVMIDNIALIKKTGN